MKLKELHLRNIASIERADIDFEHGLNDAITGEPASIFLISGDTGAGKSVILDGISMALYKKTPRLADVANVMRNEYTDAEGESIRVASIEQYTRLGISEKDASYSEVVFEGNDGIVYHARLTLGVRLGTKDKATGVRPLKHRTPLWEVRAGDGDWTKDSVEQTVCQAVGLDFQQFGRMAMLAQGQFANFLTGDKKEREAILEQLTNTQHFTAYGEAIQSLWKKAKEEQAQLQTRYDTEKPHTLSDEEVGLLTKEQRAWQDKMAQYNKAIKDTERKLLVVDAVLQNEKKQAEARQARQALEARMAGNDYQQAKALFNDWDATTAQRQHLADLTKARQEEARATADLGKTRETFALLTADIAYRRGLLKEQQETMRQLGQRVASQACHETLFDKAGETDLNIGQYLEKREKADLLSAALMQENAKTERLKKAEQEATALAQNAEKAVNDRQGQIDVLSRKRSELKPQTIIDDLKRLNSRRQELATLQNTIANLKPVREENEILSAKLQADAKMLKTLAEAVDQANADQRARKEDASKAAQRLTTMKMSLDDKIKELRHRLYDDHSANCPLCGQHIEHIHLDDDFKDMLTPLEAEQNQAEKRLKQAEAQRDRAMGAFNKLDGTHRSNQRQYEKNEKTISQTQKAINEKATLLRLNPQEDLEQQITLAQSQLRASIMKLESAQAEAESLQKDINRLIAEKKPFDSQKAEADKAKLRAETAVKTNADNIRRTEKEHAELTAACKVLKTSITELLTGYCDDWLTDTAALRQQLKADAKAFAEQRKKLADAQAAHEKASSLIATLSDYGQNICQLCPEWTVSNTAQPCPCSNINTEWTALLGKVTTLISKQRDSKVAIATAEEALAAYYEASGKTEQHLRALAGQEQQVAAARRYVAETDAQLKSRVDAIDDAQRQIVAALAELDVADRSALPDRQLLEEKKIADSKARDDAHRALTEATTRLNLHNENIQRLRDIEALLEKARQRFARWDRLNSIFGGSRFRTLVQTYILRPLLNNANIYLEQITDRYRLTCSEANEQLSILVLDRYNKDQVRSVTVLSGGERFMISLALSLALSSLNRPDMNVDILFIDEGFGTLDEKSLDSVMSTLEKLQDIAGQTNRRVGIISHREELDERIPVKIQVVKKGEGRSNIEIRSQE